MSSPARSVLGPRARVELFVLLVRQPNRAVEVGLAPVSLQQPFGFEPFEVGQIAQGSEAERLQEFRRIAKIAATGSPLLWETGNAGQRRDPRDLRAVALRKGSEAASV
jgi:hypothetical protein